MKGGIARWVKAALMAPLLAVYSMNGCTADALRLAASEFRDVADDMDGGSQDLDLGDYLSDLVEGL